jgi:hypothetical protein
MGTDISFGGIIVDKPVVSRVNIAVPLPVAIGTEVSVLIEY